MKHYSILMIPPHSERLKFYNSVAQRFMNLLFVVKKLVSNSTSLNTNMKDLSDRENNLLRNDKWGVCQNSNKFIAGEESCNSIDDIAKCESCLATVNSTFNSASNFLSFIDDKRKGLYTEDHPLKSFASDELKYFQEAQGRVQALHDELQKASNKLTTTLRNLARKFPSLMGKTSAQQSRKNKREQTEGETK